MKKPFYEMGDQIIIDEKNADSWADIIGQPLAETLKKVKWTNKNKGNFIVTQVDLSKGIVTIGRIKADE